MTARRPILLGYLVLGVLATWPRATYLATGRLPDTRDQGAYVWDMWWLARQVERLAVAVAVAVAAAVADARSIGVGWVLVWTPVTPRISHFLAQTGFSVRYRVDGVTVYDRG